MFSDCGCFLICVFFTLLHFAVCKIYELCSKRLPAPNKFILFLNYLLHGSLDLILMWLWDTKFRGFTCTLTSARVSIVFEYHFSNLFWICRTRIWNKINSGKLYFCCFIYAVGFKKCLFWFDAMSAYILNVMNLLHARTCMYNIVY